MEVIKRKILLEDSTDRSFNSPTWGVMTASTFYINVMLTQNMDDMGLFTDMSFISASTATQDQPDYSILANKLSASGITFPFMTSAPPPVITGITGTTKLVLRIPGNNETYYYNYGGLTITGNTDSKIEDLRSYNGANPFQVGFDMEKNQYFYYNGVGVSGHSRIVSMSEPKIYVFDTLIDGNTGTLNQVYGIAYTEYSGQTRLVTVNGKNVLIPVTTFNYKGQGWNDTNVSLSALTKEEYLFGIISPPEVQSDVFIDRGETTVMDKHLRMSEIKNMGQLERYGNGFYNLTKV
jgi:hypothetical protein